VKLSSLKAGESVEGNLARDLYSPENRVFASGSHIRLTVSRVERKPKTPSEKWPWIAKIFLPHHENAPVFNEAAIFMPDGTKSAIQASLLSSNRMKQVGVVSTGFTRPYPGESKVRAPREFNNPAPTKADLDD